MKIDCCADVFSRLKGSYVVDFVELNRLCKKQLLYEKANNRDVYLVKVDDGYDFCDLNIIGLPNLIHIPSSLSCFHIQEESIEQLKVIIEGFPLIHMNISTKMILFSESNI